MCVGIPCPVALYARELDFPCVASISRGAVKEV